MEIRTIGSGKRLERCGRILSDKADISEHSLFLLPIPSTKDKITVTGTDTELSRIPEMVNKGDTVAGYGIPEEIKKRIALCGGAVYDGALDEGLLSENAELTARGALGYILTEYGRDVTDLRIGIVGIGRIGSRLLHYLVMLGASPTAYTTRESLARELCEWGIDAPRDFAGAEEMDILVNTAPAKSFDEEQTARILEKTQILDLASGRIFPEGENVVKLPSIPEKFYPESAGEVYAKYVLKFIEEEGRE